MASNRSTKHGPGSYVNWHSASASGDALPASGDGTVTDGPYPETNEVIGGFAVVDVPTRKEALEWAAKIAAACRCSQEVREFLPDPTV